MINSININILLKFGPIDSSWYDQVFCGNKSENANQLEEWNNKTRIVDTYPHSFGETINTKDLPLLIILINQLMNYQEIHSIGYSHHYLVKHFWFSRSTEVQISRSSHKALHISLYWKRKSNWRLKNKKRVH